jgi:hypothetical protein
MTGANGRWLIGLGVLAFLPGCLSFCNPVPKAPAEEIDLSKQLPPPARAGVVVVLINGADPLQCGNLQGLRDHLAKLGYIKCYYAQVYHEPWLFDELQRDYVEHPESHFVFVGFEYGAPVARKLANRMVEKGLPANLLVYLQPKGFDHENRPSSSAERTITIRAADEKATASSEGESIEVKSLTRYGVPTNPETLKLLASELFQLASTIHQPAALNEPFPSIMESPAPPPRPVKPISRERVDEWDFLKPPSVSAKGTASESNELSESQADAKK